MYMCFSKTPALSPTGEARPFDAEADGTILGEGLGVVVLKRLADARRDGDRVYAVIRSIGTSSDGKGQAVYAPSAAGQAKALRQAYALAGISPGDGRAGRGPRHRDARSATRPSWRRSRRSIGRARPAGGVVRAGFGQVAGRAHQGRRGRGRADQGRAGAASQGPAADLEGPPADRSALAGGDSPFYVNTEARPWLTDGPASRGARPSARSASAAAISTACSKRPSPRSRRSTGTATCRSSRSRPTIAPRSWRELRAWRHRPDWPEVRAAGCAEPGRVSRPSIAIGC